MPKVRITARQVVHYSQEVTIPDDLWRRLQGRSEKAYLEAVEYLDLHDVSDADDIETEDVDVELVKEKVRE